MQPLSPSPQRLKPQTRFGSAGGGSGLGLVTGAMEAVSRRLENNRGIEMLFEDVVGFGLLRTGLDLRRNKMYGDDSLNVPAAAERFAREICSILTDCVLGGMVALGVGKAFDRKNQAFSSQFIQYPSLELFKDITKNAKLEGLTCPNEAQTLFKQALAERLVLEKGKALPVEAEQAFNAVWNQKPSRDVINDKAKALVKAVNSKAKDFNLSLRVNTPKGSQDVSFAVNDLLDDVSRFSRAMGKAWEKNASKNTITWQAMAKKAIERTITAKNVTIPIGLAAGMSATFISPFLLNGLTKKVFGIDYFPGETSLRKNQPNQTLSNPPAKKGFWEKHFPYVAEALKNGNPLPLVGSLVPLLAAVGAFDTYNRRFINPINGLRKGTLKKLFDFSKKAPFTSQQQMAAMFALLITSRLLSSRSDNEYKERILDSAVGWGAWIVGTPLLKKFISKALNSELIAKDGSVKSREAVAAFSKNALAKNVWVGIGSTLGTIGILGVGAPLAGIKLTQWNEKRKQQNTALGQPVPAQSMPAQASVAPKPFTPSPVGGNPFAPGITRPIAPPQGNAFLNYPPNYAWPQRPN